MKVTTKGQVTIPAHIQSYLGITPGTVVDFQVTDGEVLLAKLESPTTKTSSRFARFRGTLKGKHTTDAWMRATRGD